MNSNDLIVLKAVLFIAAYFAIATITGKDHNWHLGKEMPYDESVTMISKVIKRALIAAIIIIIGVELIALKEYL